MKVPVNDQLTLLFRANDEALNHDRNIELSKGTQFIARKQKSESRELGPKSPLRA